MEYWNSFKSFSRLVVLISFWALKTITPAAAQCPVLVGGSDFYDMSHSDTLWAGDLNLVETVGPEGSKFSSGLVYADSAQAFLDSTRSVYAVTTNPHLLDSTYVDMDQNMLVAHIGKEDEADYKLTKLISYKIGGIDKGSDFTVEFDLYGLNGTKYGIGKTAASWDPYEVTVGIDLDQYGASSCKVSDAFRVDPGTSTHVKLSGTLADGLDYIKLDIIAGYNYVKGMTVGISNLRVKGCYKPHVTSSMGIEICAGEQALISLDKEYNAASYKWFSSTDGSSFKEVGSKKSLYEELKKADASYYYYCLVNGVNSDTIHIKTITCCVDGEGNPMSRMDVFYDDFGYFDDIRSYTDAFGNTAKQPDTYAPERADVTFDLSKTGMVFDPSGQINDGYYGVVVPSPTGYYQDISGNSRATWMSGVSSDHSSLVTGKSGGGALFMNITLNYSDLIFTRQIDGLCTDKNIYFETYIANMSGGTDPEVTINIKDAATGKVLASDKKTATAGAGWIRVHIDELQVSSSSIILEIVSTGTGDYSYWDKGNDLIIDDIRFMVCSPPSIDIYSNLESFASDTVICANTDFTMGSQVSELLTSFFKGQQKYLFQQSTDGKVWNNMGGISDKETYSFNTADYPADTNYFRVVVANADALQKFIADPSDADYEDKCRNYSISKPFKIVRAGAIDMGKDMELSGCRTEEVVLNGSNDGTIVRWSWEDADGNVLVPVSSDEKDKTYTYEVAENGATLYFVGYNSENCVGRRKFTVTENTIVEATLSTERNCGSTSVMVDCKATGASYLWSYDGLDMTETGPVLELDASYPDAVATVTVSAPGYCDVTFSPDIVINKVPDAPVPVKTLMSQQVKAGVSVSLEEMVAGTDGIEWSPALNGKCADDWSTTVPSQPLDVAGTFPYWIRAVSDEGCPSDTVRLIVVVNEAPMPEVRNDTVCLGTKIDFTKYITKSDPGFKLLWYNAPDGKGTEHMNSYTATVGGMSLEYWVSQASDNAESDKAHMVVYVATVPKPVVDNPEVVYCLNDKAAELTATVTEKPYMYYFANGIEWRLDGEVVETPVPSTDKAGVYEYTVYGTFSHPTTLNGDAVCYSEPVTMKVDVRETLPPTSATQPAFTVNYSVSEGLAAGGFADVASASDGKVAETAGAGYSLVWYDAAGNKLSAAPVPPFDPKQDKDMTYTYLVSQVDEYGCESEKVPVTVNINGTPTPVCRDTVVCAGRVVNAADLVAATSDEYKLVWYSSPEGGGASEVATLFSESEANTYRYYVAQVNKVSNEVSRIVSGSVVVIGVLKPELVVPETTYCRSETPIPFVQMFIAQYQKADGVNNLFDEVSWTDEDGKAYSTLDMPNTDVTSSTTYRYTVSQQYTVPSSGDVCVGEPVGVVVNVKVVGVPGGTHSVNYVKTDAEANGGAYKNLLEQNVQAAVADNGCSLNWFDAAKNRLNAVPVPAYDASLDGDAEFTYYVSQTDENGCESDLVPVTVTISSSPIPSTESVAYCEGETAVPLTAKINVAGNGDAVDDYTLVWYSDNPNTVSSDAGKAALELPDAPVPSTAVSNGETFQVYTYYVAQKRVKDGKEVVSRAAVLVDSVYARPRLVTANPDPVCEPATVDLTSADLWSVKAAKVWAKAYIQSSDNDVAQPEAVAVSGTYYTQAYFFVRGNQCLSKEEPIEVRVDYIRDLAIDGPSTTCPGTSVELAASSSAISPSTVSYTWVSNEAGENKTVATPAFSTVTLAGPALRTYTYTLTAEAGACKATAESITISIGDGPVVGSISFSEDNNSESTQTSVSANGHVFYTCGTEVTLDADVVSTADDFVWTHNGKVVGQGASLKVDPTSGTNVYTLSYTNQCPTSFDVTLISVPLSVVATNTPYNICEGDNFEADLSVNCPENTYKVKWFHNDLPIDNESGISLKIASATTDDNGVYSCMVFNRGCFARGTIADGNALKVRPVIKLTYADSYIVRRDSLLSVPLNITVPVANDPANIEWTENGVHFASGNPLSLKVTADHHFNVLLSDDDYCDAEAGITVKVDARLQLRAHLDEMVCRGSEAELVIDTIGTGRFVYPEQVALVVTEKTADGARSYTSGWNIGDDGRLHLQVTPLADAIYTVQFSYRRPADGTDYQSLTVEKSIKVLDPPSIDVPNGNLAVCGDGQSTLEVKLYKVYPDNVFLTWEDDSTIVSGLDGPAITVAPVYDKARTEDLIVKSYYVHASFSICPEMVYKVNVTVWRPLTGEIVAPEVICEGAVATLDASSFQASQYLWTSADDSVADSVKRDVIYVKPERSATYSLEVNRGQCTASAEFSLTVSPLPKIVSIDSLSYNQRDVVVSGGTEPYTYWYDDNTAVASGNSTFSKIAYGSHMAFVADDAGCVASAPFMVNAPQIVIPKILSPNDDGINDFFTTDIIREAYPNAVVRIFDRYGKELATYKGEDVGWDGTYNGSDMRSTDYWYEIEVKELNKTFTGHFTLMRQ